MSYEFRMPDIGEGIAEVEVIEWLVAPGEHVGQDQPTVTVETDKARVDIPSPVAGRLAALGAQPGEFIAVGSVLFTLDNVEQAVGAPAADVAAAVGAPSVEMSPVADGGEDSSAPPATEAARGDVPATGRKRVKAAPSVRRFADEQGVDISSLAGTGPDSRITKQDVLAATSQPATSARAPAASPVRLAAPAGRDEVIPLRGLRRQIAKNMIQSWRTIPHIIDWRQADATRLVEARGSLRAAHPDQAGSLSYVPLLVKIVATALRANPLMNASITPEEDGYILHSSVNVGIATSTPDGLLVPVVRDADQKSVLELAAEIVELVELTRNRKASTEQLTGGTYTVNNVGALGATMGTPIIRPPEVGILGFGRITDTVVARDGQPVVRPVMTLSCVSDHRLHDGAELSAFTRMVVELIEDPIRLLGELR